MSKDISNEQNFLKRVHEIAQKTVAISSTKHTLGLTESQKLVVEQELDRITESCRRLTEIGSNKK